MLFSGRFKVSIKRGLSCNIKESGKKWGKFRLWLYVPINVLNLHIRRKPHSSCVMTFSNRWECAWIYKMFGIISGFTEISPNGRTIIPLTNTTDPFLKGVEDIEFGIHNSILITSSLISTWESSGRRACNSSSLTPVWKKSVIKQLGFPELCLGQAGAIIKVLKLTSK